MNQPRDASPALEPPKSAKAQARSGQHLTHRKQSYFFKIARNIDPDFSEKRLIPFAVEPPGRESGGLHQSSTLTAACVRLQNPGRRENESRAQGAVDGSISR